MLLRYFGIGVEFIKENIIISWEPLLIVFYDALYVALETKQFLHVSTIYLIFTLRRD